MDHFIYTHPNTVAFRKADKCDARKLLDLKNESHFGTHAITFANLTSQEKWLESISHETQFPKTLILIANVALNTSSYDCGVFKFFNIDWQNRKADVGWDIFHEWRGKGYGKKLVIAGVAFAFNLMNLHRLDAQILVTNEASLKCAEAAGFIIEGRQRQVVFKNGQYVDNLILGVLNESNI
jgi:RimJ/RimL family protein N-acetyltransferase